MAASGKTSQTIYDVVTMLVVEQSCAVTQHNLEQIFGLTAACNTSLMIPCPWALHAMRFLADNPEIPFGVHITVICDADDYTWGPVTSRELVKTP